MDIKKNLARAAHEDVAFRELYEATIDKIYSFVYSRLGNRELAKDTCQNIYIALWQSLRRFSYKSDEQFYAYLFTIARRHIGKALRAKPTTLSIDASDFCIAGEGVPYEDYRALFSAIQKLTPKEQMCVQLRYFSDWQFKEIANAMHISETYAKVLHHRAVKKLTQYSIR